MQMLNAPKSTLVSGGATMALELKNNGQPIDRNTYQIRYIITPEEQEILSRYVGWGGIPEV